MSGYERKPRDKPLRVKLAQFASEEFLQQVKDMSCERCVIRLACMSRVMPSKDFYWCKKCQGWWLVDEELLVRCEGHTLNDPEMIAGDSRSLVLSSVSSYQTEHSIQDCPNCTPGERVTFRPKHAAPVVHEEAPTVRVIDGYNIKEHP